MQINQKRLMLMYIEQQEVACSVAVQHVHRMEELRLNSPQILGYFVHHSLSVYIKILMPADGQETLLYNRDRIVVQLLTFSFFTCAERKSRSQFSLLENCLPH